MPKDRLKFEAASLSRRSGFPLLMAGAPLLLLIGIPLLALLTQFHFRFAVEDLWTDSVSQKALCLSLYSSCLSTFLVMLFGTPLACLLARPEFRRRTVLDSVLQLATVVPPAVAGIALLMAFGRNGLVGSWLNRAGITLPFTTAAVVMAQMFVSAPYFIKTAALAIGAIDPELQQVARLEGAGNWQVFRHILLPLAWRGFVAGAAMTWARAIGEFGATIIFAGNYPGRTQTLPIAVYLGLETGIDRAVTMAVILLLLSFAALTAIHSLSRSRD